nr:hypothetical protein [uncultured Albidiferax sp.]
MTSSKNILKENEVPMSVAPLVPIWKTLLLVTMVLSAGASIIFWSVYLGGLLLIAATIFQIYGGFLVPQQFEGESRRRNIAFVVVWILVIVLSVASQWAIQEFSPLFMAMGEDLPFLSQLTLSAHSSLLLLPVLVGAVRVFWPTSADRLLVATMFGWCCVVIILGAFGTLYLPLLRMS